MLYYPQNKHEFPAGRRFPESQKRRIRGRGQKRCTSMAPGVLCGFAD